VLRRAWPISGLARLRSFLSFFRLLMSWDLPGIAGEAVRHAHRYHLLGSSRPHLGRHMRVALVPGQHRQHRRPKHVALLGRVQASSMR
jgi:hypothetical protein